MIATASMPEQLSPLQEYLKPQGKRVSEINDLAQQLFQNALAISQESKEIADLQARFGDGERTVIATATLNELIYSHHGRLEAALRRERQLLAEVRNAANSNHGQDGPHAVPLTDAADRNLALARELTQTNHPATRSADKILAEMSLTLNDLVAGVHEAYGKSQSDTALGGKK